MHMSRDKHTTLQCTQATTLHVQVLHAGWVYSHFSHALSTDNLTKPLSMYESYRRSAVRPTWPSVKERKKEKKDVFIYPTDKLRVT